MNAFNAYEVFEIAEQIERNGGKFYRRAAEITNDEKAKGFLNKLAEMEDSHESFFKSLKEKFSLEQDSPVPDLDNQTVAYLQAMAEGKVFSNIDDPSEKIKEDASVIEIINMAICFEKDTIVYFTTIKDLVPAEFGKEKIDALIKEEISHIGILLEEKKKVAA
jgi:rubrerythrin